MTEQTYVGGLECDAALVALPSISEVVAHESLWVSDGCQHLGDEDRTLRKRTWWRRERWGGVDHVRSGGDLTVGERAADLMRNAMGSWAFVFGALICLAVWMGYNGNHGFDRYPFILLNLVLSCLAAMQGAILLIAAKRADAISAELAKHDYEVDCDARDMLRTMKGINQRIENSRWKSINTSSRAHANRRQISAERMKWLRGSTDDACRLRRDGDPGKFR